MEHRMLKLNDTHDPKRRSWMESANAPGAEFPIQNLPFGVFRIGGASPRGGVAIGDQILDLKEAAAAKIFTGEAARAAKAGGGETLEALMRMGVDAASALRAQLSDVLRDDNPKREEWREKIAPLLSPIKDAEMLLPMRVDQFSDMSLGIYHHTRFRAPNADGSIAARASYKYVPSGYNARASTVVIDGTPVRRPNGQFLRTNQETVPEFGPEPRLDYELELAIWMAGPGNPMGEPIPIDKAEEHIFGFCLLNDWSARRIQVWEGVLGPFLSKSMGTTISPWVVTLEAMAPFRIPAFKRDPGDPAPFPYLYSDADQAQGGLDLTLESFVTTAATRAKGLPKTQICRTNYKYVYWTWAQVVAHHSSNGCNLPAGTLIASGTVSGPDIEMAGCLNEKTMRATKPWTLPSGESRIYLEDGDEVTIRAHAEREGFVSIGFGQAAGVIEPAPALAPGLLSKAQSVAALG